MKLLHQRHKTICVAPVVIDVYYRDIFIRDADLYIVGGQKLVVPHIVPLHPHKGCRAICLGITVPVLTAYTEFLYIFTELVPVFREPFVIPLRRSFPVSSAVYKAVLVDSS